MGDPTHEHPTRKVQQLELHMKCLLEVLRAGRATYEAVADGIIPEDVLKALGWQDDGLRLWKQISHKQLRLADAILESHGYEWDKGEQTWVPKQPDRGFGTAQTANQVAIRKGEFITCEAGHLICEVMEDIELGERNTWAQKLGAWRLTDPPQVGRDKRPKCPCGAEYWNGATLHVKGRGWS